MKVKVREKSGILDVYSGYYLKFDAYVANNKVIVTYTDPEKHFHVGLGVTTKQFPTWGKANAFLASINAVGADEETPNLDAYRDAYTAYHEIDEYIPYDPDDDICI